MTKLAALASILALTSVPVAVAAQRFNQYSSRASVGFAVRPSPRSTAIGCVLAATNSGAYVDWDADAIVKHCVDLAKGVQYADYNPDEVE